MCAAVHAHLSVQWKKLVGNEESATPVIFMLRRNVRNTPVLVMFRKNARKTPGRFADERKCEEHTWGVFDVKKKN